MGTGRLTWELALRKGDISKAPVEVLARRLWSSLFKLQERRFRDTSADVGNAGRSARSTSAATSRTTVLEESHNGGSATVSGTNGERGVDGRIRRVEKVAKVRNITLSSNIKRAFNMYVMCIIVLIVAWWHNYIQMDRKRLQPVEWAAATLGGVDHSDQDQSSNSSNSEDNREQLRAYADNYYEPANISKKIILDQTGDMDDETAAALVHEFVHAQATFHATAAQAETEMCELADLDQPAIEIVFKKHWAAQEENATEGEGAASAAAAAAEEKKTK
jgi:hypothetical protein